MSTKQLLEDAFRSSLGLGADVDLETIAYGEITEWDSVAHMQLVVALEEAFDIMMETDDVIGMSDFRVAREILRSKYDIRFES